MEYDQGNPDELKRDFWQAMEASPLVMLQLDAIPHSAAPMTAQLDKDASHAIWFFTRRDNHFAASGVATATFAGKDHKLFARFEGTLREETDRSRLDRQWNNAVASWYPGGKDDPDLLLLRMDLGDASIWSSEAGLPNTVKMALGLKVANTIKGGYTETRL